MAHCCRQALLELGGISEGPPSGGPGRRPSALPPGAGQGPFGGVAPSLISHLLEQEILGRARGGEKLGPRFC